MSKRKPMGELTHIGIVIEKATWEGITRLAEANDVSAVFIVRRSLAETVASGRVPWPSNDNLRQREPEKPNAATPVYDGESETKAKGRSSGRKAPVTPVQ